MDCAKVLVGVILPYVAVIVFLAGMAYRLSVWKKLASPKMTLFPAPPTEGANFFNTLKEVFLFKSLFSGDRVMWVLAWVFHAVLALIVLGHLRVFFNVDAIMIAMGMSEEHIKAMSNYAGGAAGVVILVMIVLILIRRMAVQRVREITGTADVFALLLLATIVITGDAMRFAQHVDLADTREYFAALGTFQFSAVMGMEILANQVFLVHMLLALVLIMLIPFSKILHLGGIFFTHQLVRKH